MPRRRRAVATKSATPTILASTPALPAMPPPPIRQGVDAVVAWLNRVNVAAMELAQQQPHKHRALQQLVAAFGRCRTVARDVELLLRAREQRDGVLAAVAYQEAAPFEDSLAMPLWAAMELVRLVQLVLAAPELDREDLAAIGARIKHYVAFVTVREAGATADFKRRHKIGTDVVGAIEGFASVQAELAEEALTQSDAVDARTDLIAFCKFMCTDFDDPWHVQVIADALMRAERREITGLIINIPPGHGKTQLASRLFTSWYLGRNPTHDVIVGCMAADFAENEIGGPVRNYIQSPEFRRVFDGVNVSNDTASKSAFNIYVEGKSIRKRRGKFRAFGREGSPTGSRCHLLVLDDFISESDAYSSTERAKLFNQILRFRTRMHPGAIWVVINTRYHEDDVVGVIKKAYGKDRNWEVLTMPAVAKESERWPIVRPATSRRPETAAVHTRLPGEPLWNYKKDDVEALRRTLMIENPAAWWGQFMCQPVADSGAMIDVKWFRRYDYADVSDIITRAVRVVVSADTGGTRLRQISAGAARTAITVWAELEDGRAYLVDVRAAPWIYPDLLLNLKETCRDWKPSDLLIENKAAGTEAVVDLSEARDWVRTPITPVDPVGPKPTRMAVASPQIRSGQVYVPAQASSDEIGTLRCVAPAWLEDYLNEMLHFPLGSRVDLGDATSQFLNWRRENPVYSSFGDVMSQSRAKQELHRALGGPFGSRSGAGGGVLPRQRIGAVSGGRSWR